MGKPILRKSADMCFWIVGEVSYELEYGSGRRILIQKSLNINLGRKRV